MLKLLLLSLIIGFAFAQEGEIIFKNSCMRCHTERDKKPLSYLKEKYKGKPEEIMELAKRCPWGQGLSDMEIELVSKWISGN